MSKLDDLPSGGNPEDFTFGECREIKKIGEEFRESSIEEITDNYNLSEDFVEEAVESYIALVTEPAEMTSIGAIIHGTKFFSGRKSISEISEEEDESSEDKIKENIRKFLSATKEETKDIELDRELPESENYPERFEQIREETDKILKASEIKIGQVVDFTEITGSLMSSIFEPLNRMGEILDELQRQAQEAKKAIENNISNFQPPAKYDPDKIDVDEKARNIAESEFGNFILELDNCGEKELESYIDRLVVAYESLQNGNYHATIFITLSVQDGLMHWICEENNVSYDDTTKQTFKHETKINTLFGRFNNSWNINKGHFCKNLKNFWPHRHAIMHGDSEAEFDDNIATISILFLIMTLDTALNDAGVYN